MQIKKFVGIFFAGVVLIIGFWWVGSACYQAWNGYQWQKQTDAFMEAGRKPYKDDTYGGKTPEETWTMFLDALKKGDVELASKYFVVEKQKDEIVELSRIVNEKKVEEALKIYSTFESDDKVNAGSAYYHIKVPYSGTKDGFVNSPIVFSKNNYTGIWKISVL